MAFKSQLGIRLGLEISLEIACERSKSFLLAGKKTSVGIFYGRFSCRKIDAVQGKPFFNCDDLRRRRRRRCSLHLHRGSGRSSERWIAIIAYVARNGNCARLCASAVQGGGRGGAGDVPGACSVAVGKRTAIWAAGG